ncbi:armadillo-type protein [Pavlovales sp. CCMP2436]|nr:armadillo-type protein [Pavlovales sp. CCMP2436]
MQAAVQQCLEHTVSADKAVRKQAEEQLRHAEGDAGFSLILLAITADNSAALGARQAGAVYFKNLVKQRWTDDERPLPPADKEAVKAGLLGLMVSVPELVQRQLSEAISTISTSDFPEQWPSLLPELVNKLGTAASAREWGLVNGLLLTCTAMFRPYRHEFKSDALFTKIKYVLAHLQEPLLQLAKGMGQQLEATSLTSPADARGAGVLLTCLETATEVHISLASQELPEYFEDHMGEWMGVFQAALDPVL